ncbi:MAG: putative RNA methylase [Candidatus Azotimanducaceae bacterium]|jgi:predicted RNA methylase
MVLDEHRNGFYYSALKSVITPDSVVMDLGAGLGVLGLMAAKLGAAKVYLIEPATDLVVAKELATANGLLNNIVYIPESVEQAGELEPVDVIVSVFTGNFLLEEDLLPSLFFAREQYLRPGGTLIPNAGQMFAQPVTMQSYFDRQVGKWTSESNHIDHSVMSRYAANSLYYEQFNQEHYEPVADPLLLQSIDFYHASEAACRAKVKFVATHDAVVHGFLGWFDIELGEARLSTAPDCPSTHWSQAFLPVETPFDVRQGDEIGFELSRPETGEWSWRILADAKKEQHSTFLSRPFSAVDLARRSVSYKPSVNAWGEAAIATLNAFGQGKTVQCIAGDIQAKWPRLFPNEQTAIRFVQQQVDQFGRRELGRRELGRRELGRGEISGDESGHE